MNNYRLRRFRTSELTSQNLPCAFERFLFNEPGHLLSQPGPEPYTFLLENRQRRRMDARFSLFVEGSRGLSPYRAPFGSLEFNPGLETEQLDFFLAQIDEFAQHKGLTSLQIKHYPFCYAPAPAQILSNRLLHRGYATVSSELAFYLPVTPAPFRHSLDRSERGKLNKCQRHGLRARKLPRPDLDQIYDLILDNRQRRGFPMSLNRMDFGELFARFPDHFQVFGVEDGTELAAVAVTVRISATVLYTFYLADTDAYKGFSPVVPLVGAIYEHGQQHGYSTLDLGIATDGGAPNYGLIRFKQNLGAQPSLKLTFQKNF